MRQVAARVKHPCFGVRVASVHKINRLHLENVACRGEKLLFEKTVFKTFCGEKDDKYMKTPHFRAVFSVLHLSSTHFGMPDWIRTSGLQSRSLTLYPTELRKQLHSSLSLKAKRQDRLHFLSQPVLYHT